MIPLLTLFETITHLEGGMVAFSAKSSRCTGSRLAAVLHGEIAWSQLDGILLGAFRWLSMYLQREQKAPKK